MQERVDELDVCKGMGMTLVIMGHMIMLGAYRNWVCSFYMPMFVVISGLLYRNKDIKTHFRNILLPYYKLGTACICVYNLLFEPDVIVK